ncbi:hypothetical protein BS78_10G134600 [Paspalum vaginatum]|nr:hypothetical protein BS78_10G134600 [Paspalum vaginatum]
MQIDVEMQKPTSLEDAMAQAHSFERCLQLDDDPSRVPARAPAHYRPNPPPAASPRTPQRSTNFVGTTPTPSAPMKPPVGSRFTRLSTEEMVQCRLDGLCYNCPEKFSREHLKQCTMKGIYLLIGDPDDAEDKADNADNIEISLHALAGVMASRTLQLTVNIGSNQIRALVDSGSTHSFIATDTARRLGLQPVARPGQHVDVANGDRIVSTGICKKTSLSPSAPSFSSSISTFCPWMATNSSWGVIGCVH